MKNKCPDKWVILNVVNEEGFSFRKILSSWYGGYLSGDSWNLSSPIIEFNDKDTYFEIKTESSAYICYKNSYGMSSYTNGIYLTMLESTKSKSITLTLVKENELWTSSNGNIELITIQPVIIGRELDIKIARKIAAGIWKWYFERI